MKTIQGVVFSAACALAVMGMLAMISGCSSTGKLAKEEAGYSKDKVDARGLFVETCARCHGEDGRAKTFHGRLSGAQNFTDAKWRTETTNDEIIHAIKNGHENMPAFENKLSEAEIEALGAYVQTFQPVQ